MGIQASSTFSVVIPVRDAWDQLEECLNALAAQESPPDYDVTVVDDGSSKEMPSFVSKAEHPFRLRIETQVALGISAARNAGIVATKGRVLVFIDSDVTVERSFLRCLFQAIEEFPEESAFQARLIGGKANLVERMEGLRLEATQETLLVDGRIRYVNTSAFAVRRSFVESFCEFFDVGVVRGEDTLVLARLLARHELPRFVPDAVAVHRPRARLHRYVVKHFAIGYYTSPARRELRALGATLLPLSGKSRLLGLMWKKAARSLHDLVALMLVSGAHILERGGRAAYWAFGVRRGQRDILSVRVDPVREPELLARVTAAAARRQGMCVTYLTAWTLVQAERDPSISDLLRHFDICYADGMGVALASRLLRGSRLKKVTANNFMGRICAQLAKRQQRVAIVGAEESVAATAASRLLAETPGLDIVLTSHGYLSEQDEERLRQQLFETNPHVVFVGMGQPIQERWVQGVKSSFPSTVFFCVGGLFDYIEGRKPTPPPLVRRVGLEWLYLLLRRPKRFWRRYLVGLPILGMYIVRSHLRRLTGCALSKGAKQRAFSSNRTTRGRG